MPRKHGPSRRVFATVHDHVSWRLYAAIIPAPPPQPPQLCELLMAGKIDEGTICASGQRSASGQAVFPQAVDPSNLDFSEADQAGVSLIEGIAPNAAAQVKIFTPAGRSTTLALSPDRAFLHFCGRAGCGCEIDRIEALSSQGRVLAVDADLVASWCHL